MNTPAHQAARILLPAALFLGCALALSACTNGDVSEVKAAEGKDAQGKDTVPAVPVEAVKASHRAIAASYTGTAALEPRAEAQVVARTSGVAMKVLVEEGQVVRAGQALIRLDPDRARLAVAQTEAQLRKLENNYHRAQQLVGQRMVSASDVDQLRYDTENMRAQHQLAQLELSFTTVIAPISGVVASRSIKDGNFVQINTPVLRIVDNAQLEAVLNVPERELATLKPGQPVTLVADALPGRSYEGHVDRVSPVVDSGSGTFRVVCAFAGAKTLQPGMFGRVRIDYDTRADALVVPRVALLDDGDPAVYVVRDGKSVRTPVTPGYSDGEWIEIRKGLKLGDAVVTAGKVALRDGTVVQVIDTAAPKVAAAAAKDARG
ncbi:MAG: efflux RND transporter periplasmic adaptor subunit [Pseudoxanthomonas sp.]